MKTSELTGAALDWAVAKAEYTDRRVETHSISPAIQVENGPGSGELYGIGWFSFRPSTDWAQGGPIIEREFLSVMRTPKVGGGNHWIAALEQDYPYFFREGLTALIAAMRCYVASKLGDEVDVPEELLK